MKAVTTQFDLKRALSFVSRFVPTKTTIPGTMNIKVSVSDGKMVLQATDLTMAMTYEMKCASSEDSVNGETTIPSKLFNDLVNNLPAENIVIETNSNHVSTVTCGKFSSTIHGVSPENYPSVPVIENEASAIGVIDASILRNALQQVTPAAAEVGSGRPVLEGVYVQFHGTKPEDDEVNLGVTFSSADGYRLASKNATMKSRSNTDAVSIIIPATMMNELSRILSLATEDVSVVKENNLVSFVCDTEQGTARVVSRIIDGTYPDITRVMPTVYVSQITVNKQELQKSVRVARLFATGNILRFKINPLLGITLSSNDARGENTSVVDADITGPETEIALNLTYVDDALNTIPSNTVVIELQSGQQPAVFIPTNDSSFKHVVMPMMVR